MAVLDDDDRTRFGPYRIVRRIGTGGMGSVFEAEDTGLGHRVALKLLHPHVAERPGAARRFLREGRAAARIQHPHVVHVLALGKEGDTPYLAMELLDRGNLSDLIAAKGALSVGEALDLVLPVIAAVAAAHDAGVIHRDLKPSNVCIAQGPGARPWPKVVDFGVSKVVSAGGHEATVTDAVIGTAAYMAPEQARAASNASFASDQYSLAVLLYQCVTGHLPFGGRSMYEVLESVMSAPVAPPSARAKDVPQALDEAVLRGMSRDPGDRFPSVRAFGAALLQLATEHMRAYYGRELHGQDAATLGVPVTSDVAGTHVLVGMATPIGDSDVPSKGKRPARPAPRVAKRAGWFAIAGLVGGALVAANLARSPKPQGPAVSAEPTLPTGVMRADRDPIRETASQNSFDVPIERNAPVASSSAISPVGIAQPPKLSGSASRGGRPRRPAETVFFGDNGAPILP